MNYPFTDADWLHKALPKTKLYRRVQVGLLTLGHLRTAEAIGVRLLTASETASELDFGLLLTICQYDWRKALRKASKASFWWCWKRNNNTPQNIEEVRACVRWWKSQNYFPSRTLLNADESERLQELQHKSPNRASSAVERLAMAVTRIQGWQTLSRCYCVWDIPMITATHLIIANTELDGAYHVPYDLIRMATNNGGN